MNTADHASALRKKLCGYRHLPDPQREELHGRISSFLKAVTFETPDPINLTEEMKILIAGHACLLLLGDIGEYSNLKSIHVHRREFRRNNDYWTTLYDAPELHLAWDKAAEGMENTSGWNPMLFRLTEALHEAIGWRGHKPAFEQWLRRYQISTPRVKRLTNVKISSTGHALQLFAQDFFESPQTLQMQDAAMFGLLRDYFQVNPLEWKTARHQLVGSQSVPAHWTPWLEQLKFYRGLPENKRALLHRRLHVLLDEIDFVGDWRMEVTEELKVSLAAQASLLLLGPGHEAFAELEEVAIKSGSTRYMYQREGGTLQFSSESIEEFLADPNEGGHGLLRGFFSFLSNPSPAEGIPGMLEAFVAYQKRDRNRKLLGWDQGGMKSMDHFAGRLFACFFEQPQNVQTDLPALYEAYRDHFGMDPLAMLQAERDNRRVAFKPKWRQFMRQNIGLYKKLPAADQKKLEQLIPDFLAQVQFIPRDLPKITEEMKLTVATEACILTLGRGPGDYRNLRTVELWKGAPDGKHNTAGDASRERVRLNWESTVESAKDGGDNYNIILHEFAHVVDNADDGEADSIPLPAYDADRSKWEALIRREQTAIRRGRFRDNKHLVREYGASNKAEFFTCATEAFFEKPIELKRDHTEIYDTLKEFYRLDPAAWPDGD